VLINLISVKVKMSAQNRICLSMSVILLHPRKAAFEIYLWAASLPFCLIEIQPNEITCIIVERPYTHSEYSKYIKVLEESSEQYRILLDRSAILS